jgi:hypothetical protein
MTVGFSEQRTNRALGIPRGAKLATLEPIERPI